MRYRLIADAGSTKVSWALIDDNSADVKRFTTDGLNAILASDKEFDGMIEAVHSNVPADAQIESVRYYGAGCATEKICGNVAMRLRDGLASKDVEVHSDLLAAARSLLGNGSGIACILGTGSNSCLYDGTTIIHNVPSLGFILGDEGSGSALGKRLISDILKERLPKAIVEKFFDRYKITTAGVLEHVYRSTSPGKWLASFVPFLKENIWNPYIYSLVRKEFENFLTRNISSYEGARTLPISFTGGIAYNFSDILSDAAETTGYRLGQITAQPLDGLVEFHRKK